MLFEMVKKLLLWMAPSPGARDRYRPERHYMRGPGPKTEQARARASRPGEPDRAEA